MNKPRTLTEDELQSLISRLRFVATQHETSFQAIESTLGLDSGFIQRLIDEKDDWAFLIKTTAILEAALGQVISSLLTNADLERHIRSLPMDGRTGKIQLAADMKIIGSKAATRLRALAEIRNAFVHGLDAVKLSINEFFARLAFPEYDSLTNRLIANDYVEKKEKPGTTASDDVIDGRAPDGRDGRYLIWAGALLSLVELSNAQRNIAAESGWRNALGTLGQAFIALRQGKRADMQAHVASATKTLEAIVEQNSRSGNQNTIGANTKSISKS